MKLASVLSLSLVAAFAASARAAATDNVLGVLRVDSNFTRTVVAVPWVDCASGDEQGITVSNVVQTANLTEGDTIHVLASNGNYNTWKLQAGADSVLYWQSVNQVSTDGEATKTQTADDVRIARGDAVILIRQDASKPFYVAGQVSAETAPVKTMTAGTAESPAFNLVAPPSVKDGTIDLNSDVTWANVGAADRLYILQGNGLQVECQWKEGAWKQGVWSTGRVQKLSWVDAPAIPEGTGIWFVSKSGVAVTATWSNVPVKQ